MCVGSLCFLICMHICIPGIEEADFTRDAATDISCAGSRRDMGTQMSPCSSPGERSSCSTSTPSVLPILELQGVHFSKLETRDVQVDKRVTVTRSPKKNKGRILGGRSGNADDWKKKAAEWRCSSWEFLDTAKSISKIKRDEARITAWENLQRAKAEAAIRKLEMKLEKKKSSSMDKIMNKLRSAQKKAQEMRSSVLANQSHQASRTSHKAISFKRTHQVRSLSGCFTCHAF
ncbi:hypothetical protein Leryth_013487 [Lithospermum erythrorhizon]|nr:hypothetical protein Leryth_013487 [Lithospermum erythrorhizon]